MNSFAALGLAYFLFTLISSGLLIAAFRTRLDPSAHYVLFSELCMVISCGVIFLVNINVAPVNAITIGIPNLAALVSETAILYSTLCITRRMDKKWLILGVAALGVEKIKTIGDAYMAVAGLPIPRPDHAQLCAELALGMFDDLKAFNQENGKELDMRIGLNSGPVVAGVIGYTKFSYDLWGNTVNVASRMESTSKPGRVQVSPATYEAIQNDFVVEDGGLMECKGLGEILTHLLVSKK